MAEQPIFTPLDSLVARIEHCFLLEGSPSGQLGSDPFVAAELVMVAEKLKLAAIIVMSNYHDFQLCC